MVLEVNKMSEAYKSMILLEIPQLRLLATKEKPLGTVLAPKP